MDNKNGSHCSQPTHVLKVHRLEGTVQLPIAGRPDNHISTEIQFTVQHKVD